VKGNGRCRCFAWRCWRRAMGCGESDAAGNVADLIGGGFGFQVRRWI
jgi:hypothetical protein